MEVKAEKELEKNLVVDNLVEQDRIYYHFTEMKYIEKDRCPAVKLNSFR